MNHFEILKSIDNKFYVNIVSSNGQVLFTSEVYNSKQSAKKAITAARMLLLAMVEDRA